MFGVLPPIFVADTRIVYGYNFVALLRLVVTSLWSFKRLIYCFKIEIMLFYAL